MEEFISSYIYVPIFVTFATLLIWRVFRMGDSINYWENQGVPCFTSSIWGHIWTKFKPLHEHELEVYKKFGRIYGRYDGTTPVLTVADPDILKNILVKDFGVFPNRRDCKFGDPIMDNNVSLVTGEDWKRIRNVITPSFTSAKLKQMLGKIYTSADVVLAEMNKAEAAKKSIDVERVIGSFVMDVLASCAFGAKINSLENPNNPFVMHAKNFLCDGASIRSILPQFFPFIMKLFRISMFNPRSVSFFREFTIQAMEERSKLDGSRIDFLNLLMKAKENAGLETSSMSEGSGNSHQVKAETKFLSQNEVIGQCAMFFLAGFETTSSLIRFTLANIALHTDIQEKLWQEISSTLNHKENVEYDDIMTMKYLDAIILEGLRLSSAGIRIDRQAEADYSIEEKAIQIKKGHLISIPVYSMHRDPEWYPDPEKFDPERFTAEKRAERHPFVYLPFGLGPRSCLGNRFALLETKLIIIMIIRRFKISLSANTKLPLHFKEKQGMLKTAGVHLNIELRAESL